MGGIGVISPNRPNKYITNIQTRLQKNNNYFENIKSNAQKNHALSQLFEKFGQASRDESYHFVRFLMGKESKEQLLKNLSPKLLYLNLEGTKLEVSENDLENSIKLLCSPSHCSKKDYINEDLATVFRNLFQTGGIYSFESTEKTKAKLDYVIQEYLKKTEAVSAVLPNNKIESQSMTNVQYAQKALDLSDAGPKVNEKEELVEDRTVNNTSEDLNGVEIIQEESLNRATELFNNSTDKKDKLTVAIGLLNKLENSSKQRLEVEEFIFQNIEDNNSQDKLKAAIWLFNNLENSSKDLLFSVAFFIFKQCNDNNIKCAAASHLFYLTNSSKHALFLAKFIFKHNKDDNSPEKLDAARYIHLKSNNIHYIHETSLFIFKHHLNTSIAIFGDYQNSNDYEYKFKVAQSIFAVYLKEHRQIISTNTVLLVAKIIFKYGVRSPDQRENELYSKAIEFLLDNIKSLDVKFSFSVSKKAINDINIPDRGKLIAAKDVFNNETSSQQEKLSAAKLILDSNSAQDTDKVLVSGFIFSYEKNDEQSKLKAADFIFLYAKSNPQDKLAVARFIFLHENNNLHKLPAATYVFKYEKSSEQDKFDAAKFIFHSIIQNENNGEDYPKDLRQNLRLDAAKFIFNNSILQNNSKIEDDADFTLLQAKIAIFIFKNEKSSDQDKFDAAKFIFQNQTQCEKDEDYSPDLRPQAAQYIFLNRRLFYINDELLTEVAPYILLPNQVVSNSKITDTEKLDAAQLILQDPVETPENKLIVAKYILNDNMCNERKKLPAAKYLVVYCADKISENEKNMAERIVSSCTKRSDTDKLTDARFIMQSVKIDEIDKIDKLLRAANFILSYEKSSEADKLVAARFILKIGTTSEMAKLAAANSILRNKVSKLEEKLSMAKFIFLDDTLNENNDENNSEHIKDLKLQAAKYIFNSPLLQSEKVENVMTSVSLQKAILIYIFNKGSDQDKLAVAKSIMQNNIISESYKLAAAYFIFEYENNSETDTFEAAKFISQSKIQYEKDDDGLAKTKLTAAKFILQHDKYISDQESFLAARFILLSRVGTEEDKLTAASSILLSLVSSVEDKIIAANFIFQSNAINEKEKLTAAVFIFSCKGISKQDKLRAANYIFLHSDKHIDEKNNEIYEAVKFAAIRYILEEGNKENKLSVAEKILPENKYEELKKVFIDIFSIKQMTINGQMIFNKFFQLIKITDEVRLEQKKIMSGPELQKYQINNLIGKCTISVIRQLAEIYKMIDSSRELYDAVDKIFDYKDVQIEFQAICDITEVAAKVNLRLLQGKSIAEAVAEISEQLLPDNRNFVITKTALAVDERILQSKAAAAREKRLLQSNMTGRPTVRVN